MISPETACHLHGLDRISVFMASEHRLAPPFARHTDAERAQRDYWAGRAREIRWRTKEATAKFAQAARLRISVLELSNSDGQVELLLDEGVGSPAPVHDAIAHLKRYALMLFGRDGRST